MTGSLPDQAERLYHVFAELVRGYQFRDREGICFHGLSVSQCHTLDVLDRQGPMSMGELAEFLHLEISTVTRVVDHLASAGLATRVQDPCDRRVCRVRIARKGRTLVARVRAELIKEHQQVLREIAPQSREAVISAMSRLVEAFNQRQARLQPENESRKRRRAG